MANPICHVEFVSANLGETSAFYEQAFGWQTTPMGEEYSLWHPGGEAMGGGFTLRKPEDVKDAQRTIAYIEVEDIEATLATIEEHGGKTVYPKTRISDEHGFFAMFTDPHGSLVGLWSKA